MFYIEGPGHGGQVMVSNSYLDGSYTELFPEITQDAVPSTKIGSQPSPSKYLRKFSFDSRDKIVGLEILKPFKFKIGNTAPSFTGLMNLFDIQEIPVDQNDMQHADALVEWLESYRPEELFDKKGALIPELAELTPGPKMRKFLLAAFNLTTSSR